MLQKRGLECTRSFQVLPVRKKPYQVQPLEIINIFARYFIYL